MPRHLRLSSLSEYQYTLWEASEWQMSGLGGQRLITSYQLAPYASSLLFPFPCLINISVRNSLLTQSLQCNMKNKCRFAASVFCVSPQRVRCRIFVIHITVLRLYECAIMWDRNRIRKRHQRQGLFQRSQLRLSGVVGAHGIMWSRFTEPNAHIGKWWEWWAN